MMTDIDDGKKKNAVAPGAEQPFISTPTENPDGYVRNLPDSNVSESSPQEDPDESLQIPQYQSSAAQIPNDTPQTIAELRRRRADNDAKYQDAIKKMTTGSRIQAVGNLLAQLGQLFGGGRAPHIKSPSRLPAMDYLDKLRADAEAYKNYYNQQEQAAKNNGQRIDMFNAQQDDNDRRAAQNYYSNWNRFLIGNDFSRKAKEQQAVTAAKTAETAHKQKQEDAKTAHDQKREDALMAHRYRMEEIAYNKGLGDGKTNGKQSQEKYSYINRKPVYNSQILNAFNRLYDKYQVLKAGNPEGSGLKTYETLFAGKDNLNPSDKKQWEMIRQTVEKAINGRLITLGTAALPTVKAPKRSIIGSKKDYINEKQHQAPVTF